jgi:hypothetical protein
MSLKKNFEKVFLVRQNLISNIKLYSLRIAKNNIAQIKFRQRLQETFLNKKNRIIYQVFFQIIKLQFYFKKIKLQVYSQTIKRQIYYQIIKLQTYFKQIFHQLKVYSKTIKL